VPVLLSDAEIEELLAERKPLPPDYLRRMTLKPKRGHKEQELELAGEKGSRFRIVLRESSINPLHFSAILAYLPPRTNKVFRLRRYNGSHQHTNQIESKTFDGFHVHVATERYQQYGMEKEGAYAEPTDRYSDLNGALRCLLKDTGFAVPESAQPGLFNGAEGDEP
jgi:hypothetical protein